MKITFDEFCIRSHEFSDLDVIVKYANNYNVSRLLRDQFPFPYTRFNAEAWLMETCNQEIETNFAIANDKEFIGAIGIVQQTDVNKYSAEIGYWIAEPFWEKGIVTSALRIFTEFVFDNFVVNRIFANVFEGNIASEKVLLKTGYKKEAVLRKAVCKEGIFLDQYIYAILKEEFIIKK
jgi:[ribosomal protein S5]-alanine N-acetyltransferase